MNEEQQRAVRYWIGSGAVNIFGRPFSGKTTQARRLAEILGGHVLSGGEILRKSQHPLRVDVAMHHGELVPSNDYLNLVIPYFDNPEFAGAPLILSSIGRWSGEEASVMAATASAGHPMKAVIHLELSDQEVHSRWQSVDHYDNRGGQYKDTQILLDKRLQEYRKKTLPVIEAYEQRGLLVRVDGSLGRDEVTAQIIETLAKRALD